MTFPYQAIVITLGIIVTLFWLYPYRLSFLPVSLNGILCWAFIKIFRQFTDNISNLQRERIAVTVSIVIAFLAFSLLHDFLYQRIWWVSLGLLFFATMNVPCKR